MPYVERNWKGEIIGIYANSRPGYAAERLSDDHPDVVEFERKHPTPPEMLRPITEPDIRRMNAEHDRLTIEHGELRNAIWAFNATFYELEISLSALLHSALNIPGSRVSYAIYFSPTGFEARVQLVRNVIRQLGAENPRLEDFVSLWEKVHRKFKGPQSTRNKIAHGMPATLRINGKMHARLTSPVFDTNRVGRDMRRGQVPGLAASDITKSIKATQWIFERVEEAIKLVAVFHEKENPTLPDKYKALREAVDTKEN